MAQKEYLSFRLQGERFAFPLASVQEVHQVVAPHILPRPIPFIQGLINYRSQACPLVDLGELFFEKPSSFDLQKPLLIVKEKRQVLSFLVEAMEDVISLSSDQMSNFNDNLPLSPYLAEVGKIQEDLLLILHLPSILASLKKVDWQEILEESTQLG